MERKSFLRKLATAVFVLGMLACTKENDGTVSFKPDTGDTGSETTEDVLPTPLPEELYSPSEKPKLYKPIMVEVSTSNTKKENRKWKENKTRILPYLSNFTPDTTTARYKSITNKWGSNTQLPQRTATGRFHVEKIGDRWWIIDPEGYMHYNRSVTSVRKGSSSRNESSWNNRFGSDAKWLATTQAELAAIGFHGSAAFCTDTYELIQTHNRTYPNAPMTLAPSFGFLSQFRQQRGHAYPDGNSYTAAALVFHDDWEDFCLSYIKSALKPYLNDPNVLGFFSDNEIAFAGSSSGNGSENHILTRCLKIADHTHPAYLAAEKFVREELGKEPTDPTYWAENCQFTGVIAEKYYKGVKEALKQVDPGMMYLGTRLHGEIKGIQGVVEAAGRWCDIVSINYYGQWSPQLGTRVKEWGEWAQAPFIVTEFYTKGIDDSDLNNESGAGFAVRTQKERAYAYQHFTLGLLEATNCVGWHWFKYQDDDGTDNDSKPANKGIYNNYYKMFPYLGTYMKALNYNVYDLIDFFDNK